MVDVGAIARLLYEDPHSWRGIEDDLSHPLGYRIRFWTGSITVNGFQLGWWARFVLRRAIKHRERHLVEKYLAAKAQRDLDLAQDEVDRIFAALDAPPDRD